MKSPGYVRRRRMNPADGHRGESYSTRFIRRNYVARRLHLRARPATPIGQREGATHRRRDCAPRPVRTSAILAAMALGGQPRWAHDGSRDGHETQGYRLADPLAGAD